MRTVLVFIAIVTLVGFASAADSPGATGFEFLKTQVGARPAGMGGSFIAMQGDVQCIYYNPAGVATVPNRTASFTYMKHLLDFNFGFVGFVQPHLGPGNLGVGLSFMDYGDFKRTDGSGAVLGNFSANSLSLAATYSLQPVQNLSIGLSAKYIRAGIESYSADAVAADAGVLYHFPQWMLTLAAGVFNLGQPLSAFITHKDDLPMSLRFGLAKKLEHLPLHLSLTFYRYQDEKWHGALGGEFTLSPQAFLRLGYDNVGQDLEVGGNKDRFAGASIGLGLVWHNIHIDYALSSLGEVGTLNRFSLSSPF